VATSTVRDLRSEGGEESQSMVQQLRRKRQETLDMSLLQQFQMSDV
jgi:hypothetical protein